MGEANSEIIPLDDATDYFNNLPKEEQVDVRLLEEKDEKGRPVVECTEAFLQSLNKDAMTLEEMQTVRGQLGLDPNYNGQVSINFLGSKPENNGKIAYRAILDLRPEEFGTVDMKWEIQ